MNFEPTLENNMVRSAIRDWVSKACAAEFVAELEEKGESPEKTFKKLSQLGFSGLIVPESYEGEGRNFQGACIVAEEIAYSYPALACYYAATAFYGGAVLSELGSEEQKANFLPGCAQGKILVTPAVSEIDDDFEAEYITTTAEKDGDQYLINGKKTTVWLADQASLFLLLAKTGPEDDDLTMFCLDSKTPGINVTLTETLGRKGAGVFEVEFKEVCIPSAFVLGGIKQTGKGKRQLEHIQGIGLLFVAANALGISRGAFDYALRHAKQRVQFGREIGKFPAISVKFAENTYKIEAARLLTYQAAWTADQGNPFAKEAAMAKCLAEESAISAAMDGLQITGGYGYTMEYHIQRYIRDSMALLSDCVSAEVLKERLGASLGLYV